MSNDGERAREDEVLTDCAPLDDNQSFSLTLDIDPLSNVQLLVGPDQASFQVNELLICTYCPFFRNAFTGKIMSVERFARSQRAYLALCSCMGDESSCTMVHSLELAIALLPVETSITCQRNAH